MPADFWTSLVLGVSLALANAIASFLILRFAREKPYRTFISIVLGGMVMRMMVVLVLIAVVLITGRVSKIPFVASFFATFILASAVEVASILKGALTRAHPPSNDG